MTVMLAVKSDSGRRLLVVDDDVDTCQNLHDILTSQQFIVDTAHSGPQALEMIQPCRYAVAVLDLRMPGMNGLELFRSIRERSPETRGVLLSAFFSEDSEREAVQLGFWKTYHKPLDPARLVSSIQAAVKEDAEASSRCSCSDLSNPGEQGP
jgi:DNA-binding NtrC family response regulator